MVRGLTKGKRGLVEWSQEIARELNRLSSFRGGAFLESQNTFQGSAMGLAIDQIAPNIPRPRNSIAHDLVAWFQFNGNAKDNSGGGFHGTLGGNATVARDVYEGDGADSYMDCGSTDFLSTGPITVSCWFRAVSLGGGAPAAGRIIDNGKFIIRVFSVAEFVQVSSDGGSTWRSSAALAFDYHEWTHLAVTRTAAGVSSVYINGTLSGTPGASGTPAAGSTNVFIGDDGGHDYEWDGALDDMRVYNRVFLAHEIRQLVEHGHKDHFHANEVFGAGRVFAVQHAATAGGDGIYDCYEQILDASDWAGTGGTPKFNNRDASPTEVEVLNLAEFDPEATYVAHLAANDLLLAFRAPGPDDENNDRWVAVPFRQANADRPRIAYCKNDAGAAQTIDCYLDTDGTGTEITVTVFSTQGNSTNLNECLTRLKDGDPIIVTKIGGTWYCTTPFQPSEDCDCYTE